MIVREKAKALLTHGEVKNIIENSPYCAPKMKTRILGFCKDSYSFQTAMKLKEKLREYQLTEFEAVNIVDLKPSGLVHLQTIVEEMTERLNEEQMQEIMELIKNPELKSD